MKKIISLVIILCFLLSNFSFALSPPVVSGELGDETDEQKLLVQAKACFKAELAVIDKFRDIDNETDVKEIIKAFGKKEIFQKTTTRVVKQAHPKAPRISVTAYFNETTKPVEGLADHIFSVPVSIQKGSKRIRNYRLLFSTRRNGRKTFPILYTEKELTKDLLKKIRQYDILPQRTEADKIAMANYEEQELYDEHVIKWAHTREQAKQALTIRDLKRNYSIDLDYKDMIEEIIKLANIKINPNIKGILNKKLWIVPVDDEMKKRLDEYQLTVPGVDGKIKGYMHTSNHAVHIFISEQILKSCITGKKVQRAGLGVLQFMRQQVAKMITHRLAYELGPMLGRLPTGFITSEQGEMYDPTGLFSQEALVKANEIEPGETYTVNEIYERYCEGLKGSIPATAKKYTVTNLDHVKRRDYAGGANIPTVEVVEADSSQIGSTYLHYIISIGGNPTEKLSSTNDTQSDVDALNKVLPEGIKVKEGDDSEDFLVFYFSDSGEGIYQFDLDDLKINAERPFRAFLDRYQEHIQQALAKAAEMRAKAGEAAAVPADADGEARDYAEGAVIPDVGIEKVRDQGSFFHFKVNIGGRKTEELDNSLGGIPSEIRETIEAHVSELNRLLNPYGITVEQARPKDWSWLVFKGEETGEREIHSVGYESLLEKPFEEFHSEFKRFLKDMLAKAAGRSEVIKAKLEAAAAPADVPATAPADRAPVAADKGNVKIETINGEMIITLPNRATIQFYYLGDSLRAIGKSFAEAFSEYGITVSDSNEGITFKKGKELDITIPTAWIRGIYIEGIKDRLKEVCAAAGLTVAKDAEASRDVLVEEAPAPAGEAAAPEVGKTAESRLAMDKSEKVRVGIGANGTVIMKLPDDIYKGEIKFEQNATTGKIADFFNSIFNSRGIIVEGGIERVSYRPIAFYKEKVSGNPFMKLTFPPAVLFSEGQLTDVLISRYENHFRNQLNILVDAIREKPAPPSAAAAAAAPVATPASAPACVPVPASARPATTPASEGFGPDYAKGAGEATVMDEGEYSFSIYLMGKNEKFYKKDPQAIGKIVKFLEPILLPCGIHIGLRADQSISLNAGYYISFSRQGAEVSESPKAFLTTGDIQDSELKELKKELNKALKWIDPTTGKVTAAGPARASVPARAPIPAGKFESEPASVLVLSETGIEVEVLVSGTVKFRLPHDIYGGELSFAENEDISLIRNSFFLEILREHPEYNMTVEVLHQGDRSIIFRKEGISVAELRFPDPGEFLVTGGALVDNRKVEDYIAHCQTQLEKLVTVIREQSAQASALAVTKEVGLSSDLEVILERYNELAHSLVRAQKHQREEEILKLVDYVLDMHKRELRGELKEHTIKNAEINEDLKDLFDKPGGKNKVRSEKQEDIKAVIDILEMIHMFNNIEGSFVFYIENMLRGAVENGGMEWRYLPPHALKEFGKHDPKAHETLRNSLNEKYENTINYLLEEYKNTKAREIADIFFDAWYGEDIKKMKFFQVRFVQTFYPDATAIEAKEVIEILSKIGISCEENAILRALRPMLDEAASEGSPIAPFIRAHEYYRRLKHAIIDDKNRHKIAFGFIAEEFNTNELNGLLNMMDNNKRYEEAIKPTTVQGCNDYILLIRLKFILDFVGVKNSLPLTFPEADEIKGLSKIIDAVLVLKEKRVGTFLSGKRITDKDAQFVLNQLPDAMLKPGVSVIDDLEKIISDNNIIHVPHKEPAKHSAVRWFLTAIKLGRLLPPRKAEPEEEQAPILDLKLLRRLDDTSISKTVAGSEENEVNMFLFNSAYQLNDTTISLICRRTYIDFGDENKKKPVSFRVLVRLDGDKPRFTLLQGEKVEIDEDISKLSPYIDEFENDTEDIGLMEDYREHEQDEDSEDNIIRKAYADGKVSEMRANDMRMLTDEIKSFIKQLYPDIAEATLDRLCSFSISFVNVEKEENLPKVTVRLINGRKKQIPSRAHVSARGRIHVFLTRQEYKRAKQDHNRRRREFLGSIAGWIIHDALAVRMGLPILGILEERPITEVDEAYKEWIDSGSTRESRALNNPENAYTNLIAILKSKNPLVDLNNLRFTNAADQKSFRDYAAAEEEDAGFGGGDAIRSREYKESILAGRTPEDAWRVILKAPNIRDAIGRQGYFLTGDYIWAYEHYATSLGLPGRLPADGTILADLRGLEKQGYLIRKQVGRPYRNSLTPKGKQEFARRKLIAQALEALPEKYDSNGMSRKDVLNSFRMSSIKLEKGLDEKNALIFSEKLIFDLGLGILLAKPAGAGVNVVVVAPKQEQKDLIKELNDEYGLPAQNREIICIDAPQYIQSVMADHGREVKHSYYFRHKSEKSPGKIGGITNIAITAATIIKVLREATNTQISDLLEQKFRKAIEIFKSA
jgi:hypothetical protein